MTEGPAETGIACTNVDDDDKDSVPNDGCPLILNYSYDSGVVNLFTGIWQPFPYMCSETANSLEVSIARLGRLLRVFTIANPNTRFIIIGHSQGGLIALQALRFAGVSGITIDTVITLDGPLGGAPISYIEKTLIPVFVCWGNPAANNLNRLWISASDHENQGTTASFPGQPDNASLVQQAKDTKVMTIGNTDDCVYNPARCGLSNLFGDNTSTQNIEKVADNVPLSLGGNCPDVPECIISSHSRVLIDPFVINLIERYVVSPTVP